jgi:hypothetical protein
VQLHLGAVLDDRKRTAELVEVLERADNVVEERSMLDQATCVVDIAQTSLASPCAIAGRPPALSRNPRLRDPDKLRHLA